LAISDLFPENGGWVEAREWMRLVDIKSDAKMLLDVFTKELGSEIKARAKIAKIPGGNLISILLPEPKSGAPANTTAKQNRDVALLKLYHEEKDKRNRENRDNKPYVKAIADYLYDEFELNRIEISPKKKYCVSRIALKKRIERLLKAKK